MMKPLILAAFAVLPLIAQDKTPANLTFRNGGTTKHYDGITFDSDTSGGFWLYKQIPKEPSDNASRESIPVANIGSIEADGTKKPKSGPYSGPFPATVILKNGDVLKGWVYDWTIHVYENSLPAPMNKKLSEVTKIVFAQQ
jgi:hypothetical protein